MDRAKTLILASTPLVVKTLADCNLLPLLDDHESEEEEYDYHVPRRIPCRIRDFVDIVLNNYTDKEFQADFRINRQTYEQLLPFVEEIIKKDIRLGRAQIDAKVQLLSVVWLLATPDSYRSVGQRFNMGKASLSDSFFRVVKALNQLAPRIIHWPEDAEEVANDFYRIAHVAGVIGAIDGTYILIKAPKENPECYITRKMDYAMTLQAVCDAKLRFTDCFVGYPGSVSDTRIFRNSDLFQDVNNDVHRFFPHNQFIVGDKAYPVLPWLIPPYVNRGDLNEAKRHFNTKISQTRQVIERAFALLFGRFRRLKFLDMNRHDKIPQTVLAACVLHNLCLRNNDLYIDEYIEEGLPHVRDHNDDDGNNGVIHNMGQGDGHRIRDNICTRLYQAYQRHH